MNFLTPAFLWVLPAALLPLIIHLLNRRTPKQIPFSHIPWLKEVHQKMMPRKKLREFLLLIVRILLVAFLVMFFARPFVRRGALLTSSGEQGSMVMLVDVSASMGAVSGGREILSLAVEQAQDFLRQWPADRPVGLIVTSDQVEKELAPSTDRAHLLSTLASLKPGPRSTNIFPALKRGYEMLANQPKGSHTLLVVSDQARGGWNVAKESAGRFEEFNPNVKVVLWEVAEESPNTGVTQATLQLGEEGTLSGHADIRSYDNARGGAWTMRLNGKIVGQGSTEDEVSLQAQLPEGGSYSGALELSPDSLPFDDTFFVAGRIPKGFRVLVVDGEGGFAPSDSESYYLRSALESPRDPRLESLKLIRPDALRQENLDGYDVIVMANVPSPIDGEEEINSWVQKGGGLFLTAGSLWPTAPHGPLRLFRTKAARSMPTTLAKPETLPPLLAGLGGTDTFEWTKAGVNRYVPLEMESSIEPLLMLANGDPLLVLKHVGAGLVVCLTTSLDRSWTPLPAKPLYPPLIREVIASLADPARDKASLNFLVGDAVQIPVSSKVTRATIIGPDGSSSGAAIRQSRLEWNGLDKPGLFKVQTDVPSADFVFAANIRDRDQEGDPTRLELNDAKKIFPQSSVQWISKSDQRSPSLLAALQGKDITNHILVLVLLLFAFETLLGWRGSRRIQAAALVFAICWAGLPTVVQAGEGNQFVYAQLIHNGAWDPYPAVHERIFEMLRGMTNIPVSPQRKTVRLTDANLFESPFLLVKGNSALNLSKEEKGRLKQYIDRGGFVFFDDTLADSKGPFAQSVRTLFLEIFPDRRFQKLPIDHALFRSFFLLRQVSGRRISEKYLEGLEVGGEKEGEGRTAAVYCPNDLMGAWVKDNLGAYTFSCEPGGEAQRWEAFKLTLNIIYFSLTGTYKKDAIHQPFIEMKLGQ